MGHTKFDTERGELTRERSVKRPDRARTRSPPSRVAEARLSPDRNRARDAGDESAGSVAGQRP